VRPSALPTRWSWVLAVCLSVLLLVELTGIAQARDLAEIQRDLAEAQDERSAIEDDIAAANRAYERLVAHIAELESEGEQLELEIAELRAQLGELDELVTDRLRAVFKHGSNLDPLSVFLASEDPNAALARAETVQRAVVSDRAQTEDLAAARTRVSAAETRLAAQRDELEGARAEQEQIAADLERSFAALGELVGDLQAEEQAEKDRLERERLERERRARERADRLAAERRAREQATARRASQSSSSSSSSGSSSSSASSSRRASAAPARSSGGMACPLDQPRSFIDSWGHSRSGGRAHRGTDIMGPLGIPVRAIADGVWSIQRPGPSAGLWAILRANNGDHFWYLHLDSHTVSNGARVSAGQQVGTNGSTGNAVAGAEHIHFEWHPGGGSAVNPYSLLRGVCG
jgi:peptidoglycan LD-endopeptidase LytH